MGNEAHWKEKKYSGAYMSYFRVDVLHGHKRHDINSRNLSKQRNISLLSLLSNGVKAVTVGKRV